MTIAVLMCFGSEILLGVDSGCGVPARTQIEPTKIFPDQYDSDPGYARSIFLVGEPVDSTVAFIHYCERALVTLLPAEYTIDRMQTMVQNSLLKSSAAA